MTNRPSGDTSDREITHSRVLKAPRETVWKAFTDATRISQWWGPNGFTTTTHEMDVRPGGVWRFIMHGPDGTDYKNNITYIEVVRPERLVYTHGDDDVGAQEPFHVTITFDEHANTTKLVMKSVFVSAEECSRVKAFGAVEGGKQTLNRLEEFLASKS